MDLGGGDAGGGSQLQEGPGASSGGAEMIMSGSGPGGAVNDGSTNMIDSLLDVGGPGGGYTGPQSNSTEPDPNYKFGPIPYKPIL